MKLPRFLLIILMLIMGGAVLWWVSEQPAQPSWLQAASLGTPVLPNIDVRSTVRDFDHEVARLIRQTAEEGIDWPQVSSLRLENVANATLSAQVSTSPQELWSTFREEGSQAVLSSLGDSAQVSVNNISTEVMNEARYQYCKGVVEQYESQAP